MAELNIYGNELEKLSDNELLSVVHAERNGRSGRDAVSVLILRYLKLVLKRAHALSGDYSDVEDLTQEGLLALYKAIESYDPSRGASFSAFANTCVSNRIKTVAAGFAKINDSRVTSDDDSGDIAVSDASPENICLEKESSRSLNSEISSVLSPREIRVFGLYLDGLSYREIADKLDVTEKSVDNAMFRIRKKLRELVK